MSQSWGHAPSDHGLGPPGAEELRQLWSLAPDGGPDALTGLQGGPSPMSMLDSQVHNWFSVYHSDTNRCWKINQHQK